MQITLTEEILKGAERETENMLEDAKKKLAEKAAAYQDAQNEIDRILELQNSVKFLRVGETVLSFTLPEPNGYLVPDPDGEVVPSTDNRPEDWRENFCYSFPSRSDGRGHEVTYANGVSSCNCEAEEKGGKSNKCWARNAVEFGAGFLITKGYDNSVRVGSFVGLRLHGKDVTDPWFGLIQ